MMRNTPVILFNPGLTFLFSIKNCTRLKPCNPYKVPITYRLLLTANPTSPSSNLKPLLSSNTFKSTMVKGIKKNHTSFSGT
ncbi:MAG: hypothetical protein PF518_01300 [Spirochaetaceae bacterium]|nr:hypothetical protein [Spirochaetaceae bacterium]